MHAVDTMVKFRYDEKKCKTKQITAPSQVRSERTAHADGKEGLLKKRAVSKI